ncbi:MAG TPA: SRPBCC domain-containing protein [Terriglobia bacterium]|nr:SRPBCC domain-containing protein [Terriglobia bacterium]
MMKTHVIRLIPLLLLLAGTGTAQHAKRPAKVEEPGPVTVTRAATMRVTISSDAVGIFDYLSDPKKLTLWFPDQAIIEPHLGGKYYFRWTGTEGVWSGVVTDFIRGNTLGFTWQEPNEASVTNVRIKLFPQGAETTVELSHSGFPSSEALEKAVTNWEFYLNNLKSVIEQGADMRGQMEHKTTRTTSARRRRTS